MPSTPVSRTALIQSGVRVEPEMISKHTGAVKIKYAQVIDTWIYKIECQEEKEYDFWKTAMDGVEKEAGVVFLRVLDDDGSTEV
jgi:hypothetical protein